MVVTALKDKKTDLAIIFALLVLLLLNYFSFEFRFFFKRFTDPVALGYSNVKVYTLLGYVLAYFVFKVFNLRLPLRIPRALLIGLIIGLFLLGLSLHFFYVASYDLPFWAKTTAVYQNYFSGNHITHLHVLKPVLVVLGLPFGLAEPMNFYENGFVYFQFIPQWVYYLGALLLVLLVVFLLFYWLAETKVVPKNFYHSLTFLYLISSYSVFKNIIDGGIFNVENFLALPILLLIIIFGQQGYQTKNNFVLFLPFWFTALLPLIYSIDHYLRPDQAYNAFNNLFLAFFSMTLIYCFALVVYWFEQQRLKFALPVLALLLVLFWFLPHPYTKARLERVNHLVQPGEYVVISTFDQLENLSVLYQVGSLKYYQLNIGQPVLAKQLFNDYQLNPDYSPIDFSGLTCVFGHDFNRQILVRVLSGSPMNQEIDTIHLEQPITANIDLIDQSSNNWFDYYVDFKIRPCTPRFINASYILLQQKGLEKYIVLSEVVVGN